jgi:succinoglycan biosynthesis transport protein ExoP
MTFSQLLVILRSRWKIGAYIMSGAVLCAIAINLFWPKTYTASASVVVDVRNPDPIQGGGIGMVPMGYMATQLDIVSSEQVARNVVDALRLGETVLRQQWTEATGGKGDFRSWAAQLLQLNLDVRPAKESNVITVSYNSPDPNFSSAVANAFVKSYTDVTLSLRTNPARQSNEFFDRRAKEGKQQLALAQERLSSFQQAHGLIGTNEQFDDETAKLSSLAGQLVLMRTQSADTNSRRAQVSRQGDQIAEVLNSPLVSGLRADLVRAEGRLQELSSRLGENHPDVIQARASITELTKRLNIETSRATGGVVVSNTIAQSREAEVQAAYDVQRRRVMKLKEDHDTATILQRELETTQRNYDNILARIAQSDLESNTTLTNVTPLTPAVPPAMPSSPKPVLNAILSLVLGALISTIVIVLRELKDRRIRSAADVSSDMDLPVLGVMPSGTKMRPGAFLTLRRPVQRPSLSQSKKSLALSHSTDR